MSRVESAYLSFSEDLVRIALEKHRLNEGFIDGVRMATIAEQIAADSNSTRANTTDTKHVHLLVFEGWQSL